MSRNSGPVRDDPGTADQLVLITQLREQIAHLEKQLSGKDAQLLAKEKQVTMLVFSSNQDVTVLVLPTTLKCNNS